MRICNKQVAVIVPSYNVQFTQPVRSWQELKICFVIYQCHNDWPMRKLLPEASQQLATDRQE